MSKTKKEKILLGITNLNLSNLIFTAGIIITIISGFLKLEQNIQKIIIGISIAIGIILGISKIFYKNEKQFLISGGILTLIMAPLINAGINPNNGQTFPVSIFTYILQMLTGSNVTYQICNDISNFLTALLIPAIIIIGIKTIYCSSKK